MKHDFTDEQKNALRAKGQVLVSAAAGSGKTAVLSQRVVNMLTDESNPVPVDRLLIVTFTRAAAAEMRSRINKMLQKEIHKNPKSAHLRRQQLLLSKANICTMDSFCINLARENFFQLDMSADFRMLDNTIISQLEDDAVYKVVEEAFDEMDDDFSALLSVLGKDADYSLASYIKNINLYLSSMPFPEMYVKKVISLYEDFDFKTSPWVKTINENTIDTLNQLKTKAKEAIFFNSERVRESYESLFENLYNEYREVIEEVKQSNWDNIVSKLNSISFEYPTIRKIPDEIREEYYIKKAIRDHLIKHTGKLKTVYSEKESEIRQDVERSLPAIRSLLGLTLKFRSTLAEFKKQRNGYDFGDISHKVLSLLAENKDGEIVYTPMAKELSSRYYEVLVDEYQDTNDLQNTIFKALSDDGRKLFKVGDVKQSIYRFRKANPANFIKDMNEFPLYEKEKEQESNKVLMTGNFRSAEPICRFVNDVFGLLMSETMGEIEYTDEHKLDAKAKYQDVDNRVSVDVLDTSEEEDSATAEGKAIASYIKSIMEKGEVIKDEDKLRAAKYSDFVILLRSYRDARTAEYVAQLNKAGIPVSVQEDDGFLKSREVVLAKSLLEVIDNPTNDIPLLSVMMSNLYRFSPEEIAKIRIGSTKEPLYSSLLLAKDNPKVCDFLKEIEGYRNAAAGMSVESLLREIYNKTSMLLLAQMQEKGEQAKANLLLLLRHARDYEDSQRRGLSRFLRYLKTVEQSNERMKKASVQTSDDTVQIMTMHGSKGLQFPVCILASLGKKFDMRDCNGRIVVEQSLGVGLTIHDEEGTKNWRTMPAKAISFEIKRKQLSEELRVLYVAMTRAQDFLHLVVNPTSLKNNLENSANDLQEAQNNGESFIKSEVLLKAIGFSNWLLPVLLAHPDGKALREFADITCPPFDATSKVDIRVVSEFEEEEEQVEDTEQVYEVDDKLKEELLDKLNYEYPYKSILGVPAKHTASELAHSDMEERFAYSKVPEFLSKEKLNAAQRGTAQHTFLQFADFERAKDNLDEEIARLEQAGYLQKEQAESLNKASLNIFLNSDLCTRMIGAEKLLREHNFLVEVPVSHLYNEVSQEFDNEKIIIQGVVDCAFQEDGKMILVDYKTDRVESEQELINRYKTQLDVYKTALEQTFGVPVSKSIIYSFHLNKSVEI